MAEHALLALNDLASDDVTASLMSHSGILFSCKQIMQRRETTTKRRTWPVL